MHRWHSDDEAGHCASRRCGSAVGLNGIVYEDRAWCGVLCASAWLDDQNPNEIEAWRVLEALAALVSDERAQLADERESV